MNHHEIKCWPKYEKPLRGGTKTFEVRINDRNYREGDTFRMRFFDPYTEKYLDTAKHPPIDGKIGFVFRIDQKRVVWSILPFD